MTAKRLGLSARCTILAGLALLAACDRPSDPGTASVDPGAPPAGELFGSFSMSLTVGTKYRFSQVSYDVSGNGFHKADVINVAASATVSTVVGGIPFGTGYLLKLTAQDVDHELTPCTGTATFDITSAGTVPVPVHLSCRELPAGLAVPVPAWAKLFLAALLLGLGTFGLRPRRRAASALN